MTKVTQVRTKSAEELDTIYSKLTEEEQSFLVAVLMLDGIKHEMWADLYLLDKEFLKKSILKSLLTKKAIELR